MSNTSRAILVSALLGETNRTGSCLPWDVMEETTLTLMFFCSYVKKNCPFVLMSKENPHRWFILSQHRSVLTYAVTIFFINFAHKTL